MRKLLAIILLLTMFSCTENARTRRFGGHQEIKLESGKRLVTCTWKESNLWFLLEDMPDGYVPQKKTFYEDSSIGVFEGSITFIESK